MAQGGDMDNGSTRYGTREDEALTPYLAEPCFMSAPSEWRRQQLRSALRTEILLESISSKLDQLIVLLSRQVAPSSVSSVLPGRSGGSPSISPQVAAPVAPSPRTVLRKASR